MKRRTSILLYTITAVFAAASLSYAAPSCCQGKTSDRSDTVSLQSQSVTASPAASMQLKRADVSNAVRGGNAVSVSGGYVVPAMMYGKTYTVAAAGCCGGRPAVNSAPGCCGGAQPAPAPSAGCCNPATGSRPQGMGGCCRSVNPADTPSAGGCCGALQSAPQPRQAGRCGCSGGMRMQQPASPNPAPSALPPCCVPGAESTDNRPAPTAMPAVNITELSAPIQAAGPVRFGRPVPVMTISVPSQEKAAEQVGRPWPYSTDVLW